MKYYTFCVSTLIFEYHHHPFGRDGQWWGLVGMLVDPWGPIATYIPTSRTTSILSLSSSCEALWKSWRWSWQMRIATYHHMKAILQRQFLFWGFLIWNTAISFFVLGWWICQYCWDLHQYNPLKRPREKTEQFPQPISTYIDIPTFFFWHDHRRTFNGLDLDFWNDSCNANNIFFWKSKSWFASLPPHNRLWWQKWALWKSLLLLMMVVMVIMMILSGLCRQESQQSSLKSLNNSHS